MSITDPLIGRKLGDYTIEGVLGQGGMARVYKGYDSRLDRYSAVKVVEPHLVTGDDSEEYRQRFLREARAIARLNHPNVVGIFQFGQNEEETLYYMAMVFIEGRDLRQILKEYGKQSRRLDNALVLRIVRDIASALDYSHQQGVIHRDVKPSNIMVTAEGRAVLTDFGLALNAQEGTIGNTFGSVHYIAPEQAVSSAQAVPQSDLYALGVVVYEMLTGRVPFEDVSAMSVALKHITDPPPLPSTLNPRITPEVEDVVIKVLDKDPRLRFLTGESFVQALESAFAQSGDDDSQELVDSTSPSVIDTWDSKPFLEKERSTTSATHRVPGFVMEDVTGMRGSSQDKPGTLRFMPIEDDKSKEKTGISLSGVLVGLGVVMAAAVIVLVVVLSGASNDEVVPPTSTDVAGAGITPDATAEDEATEVSIIVEVTDEVSEIPEAVTATSVALTATPEQIMDTPGAAATSTQPVDSVDPSPTVTRLNETDTTDMPAINAESADEPQILLRYDGSSLILYNRGPSQQVNVRDLSFVRTTPTGSAVTFRASEWQSDELSFLRPQDCFQVWTVRFVEIPANEFPAEICRARQGYRQTSRSFWVTTRPDAVFEVRRGDQTLATCPAVTPDDTDEVRCLVEIRPSTE